MQIKMEIVNAFISGDDMNYFRGEWYYSIHPYTMPKRTEELVEKIRILLEEIVTTLDMFYPVNASIWTLLFPNWKENLDDITIDLIVGFSKPYDAIMAISPDGKFHIIFDINCWSGYIGKYNISELIQNFLTHELCHVMLHKKFPILPDVEEKGNYLQRLDALTFDEGFAHLISYNAKEMSDVNWSDNELCLIHKKSRERLCKALEEKDEEEQRNQLLFATSGKYYDKFACMCGMLYLANIWKNGGNIALKQVFEEGYLGFAKKSISGI